MASEEPAGAPTILISGGADGIGRRIAKQYVERGAAVHVCDASQQNIDALLESTPEVTATLADVSEPGDVDRVFADLRRHYGRLDVLVNNAGIAGPIAGVEDISITDWKQCIDVDLNGVFYMTRLATPILKTQKSGSIVNIASGAALFGCPSRSPYVASKWAMVGLTKTWAMELGPYNIRVNAICPGSVAGDRIEKVIERDAAGRGVDSDRVRDVYLRQSSMRTFVTPNDIADTVTFLTSNAGRKISGQVIAIDGHTEGLSNWLDE